MIEKLQEKKSRWRVLNPEDGEDSSELDSEGNLKIKDISDIE